MQPPALPRWWRGAVAAVAALSFFPFLLYLVPSGRLQEAAFLVMALGGAALGASLAGGMLRRGGADRLAVGFGFLGAILFAIVSASPFNFLVGLGVTMSCALLVARRDWPPAPLALGGLLLHMVGLAAMLSSRGPPGEGPRWPEVVAAAGALATAAGLLAFALRARTEAARPLARGGRYALVAAGAVLLALSWLVGGHLLFVPVWPLAVLLLVAPPLARWRAWPAGAVVVGSLALGGALPAGVCTADPWSDAVVPGVAADADARAELVTLAEVGGSGPRWSSGGGFTGLRVTCPLPVVAFGGGWALALVAASGWAARRAPGSA